ncbi:probable E3 SUMO-protein ligase RNF212 isoform X2 [Scyliorhinus canicula]|uniref:probable E3 SUMO-protein ligase RNF212 isoform X2 n=1 Tax=Scyliorhinus canicula TaxID=7830 RepID=UPI0018F47846|nr:probable E3 SUMO-protein ligase RNF212 isoform X2 [Scyliorhinus canicula]
MADWVFCNYCFQQPKANGCRFSLTSCGHVVCEVCLKKGSMDICTVCKAHCQTLFLSDKMDPDLKALFTQPEKVCERYLKEFEQLAKLKAYLQHITQRKEQLQCEIKEMKNYIAKLESSLQQRVDCHLKNAEQDRLFARPASRQQTPRLATPSSIRDCFSTPSMKSVAYSSAPHSRPSTGEMSHKMEIDTRRSPSGKSDTPMGPTRLSLISPPQDGRMGTVPYRGTSKSGAFRTTPLSTPLQQIGLSGSLSSSILSHGEGGSWDTCTYRNTPLYPLTPFSSQPLSSSPFQTI